MLDSAHSDPAINVLLLEALVREKERVNIKLVVSALRGQMCPQSHSLHAHPTESKRPQE